MNFLNQFYSITEDEQVFVSASQASNFAKDIAGDYNPIHDVDSKRFCVPGDLLFAIALNRYGLHKNMSFEFLSLINENVALQFPSKKGELSEQHLVVLSTKPVLDISYSGGSSNNKIKIEQLIRNYVAFSGHNFPDILVPLMKKHDVMINPQRPLVIYQSMTLEFVNLEFESLSIGLEDTSLEVNGKRGNAKLHFSLNSDNQKIGSGVKNLILSGLREYEEESIQQMCDRYLSSKNA